jgi:glutamyl-tRNA synthetase
VELAASAPHAEDGSSVYPGTCRGKFASVEQATNQTGRAPAIRFAANSVPWYSGGGPGWGQTACGLAPIEFLDKFRGPQRFKVARLGDFVIAKADGTPAYQLAVVIDDAEMEITDIVRGDDLLDSTPRQIMLYQALGLAERIPRYWHLPLIIGEDGRRLAKRHGDTRLSYYRQLGVSPGKVLRLLARWCGVENFSGDSAIDLLPRFDLDKLPREPIIFSAGDDDWLKGDGK